MRFLDAGLSILATLVVLASCSSSSSKGSASGDASFGDSDSKGPDAGHNEKHGAEAGAGCGRCDAGERDAPTPGHDGKEPGSDSGHDSTTSAKRDAGRDTGVIALMGGHMTGVSIPVVTATGTVMRTYDITLPDTCDSSHPLPVIFSFHGDGGAGADMYSSFPIEAAVAAAGGAAIFVYPNGTDDNLDPSGTPRAWDLYHDPGPFPYAPADPVPAESDEPSGNVDVDFFDAMVAAFEKDYCVDPSRIFITGMSSGGYLANQFARWRSGVVKATAPQSGGAPFGNPDSATGTWSPPNFCIASIGAVPVLIIHGLADTTVDPCNAIEAQSYWELTNSCGSSSGNCTTSADSCTGTNLADPPSAPTTTSSLNSLCQQTSGCGSNPVVLCEVPGLAHAIWDDAPQVIWTFFSSL